MQIQKIWKIKNFDSNVVEEIKKNLNVSEVVAKLFAARNLTDIQKIKRFLNPRFEHLYNPFLIPDMCKAVDRIKKAIENNEKILIYGDRDVDGITSVAVIFRALMMLGVEAFWYIPSEEGYGLHKDVIKKYNEMNVKLIITVDCGISAVEEIKFAQELGIDVIITDHHLPPDTLPSAYAIVHPKLSDSKYPFKELGGCGVAFKLIHALFFSNTKDYNKIYIAVDIETTGLNPRFDEICEIAAVKTKNFVEIEKFHSLIKPKKPIPENVQSIHGITNEMVKDAPPIETVLPDFIKFIDNSTLVFHNANFDLSFLQINAKRFLNTSINNEIVDTLTLSRNFFPIRSHALESLARDLNLTDGIHHRALNDSYATINLFEHLKIKCNQHLNFFINQFVDIVALSAVADILPLLDENRTLVYLGLNQLQKTRNSGLKNLINRLKRSDEDFDYSAKGLSWSIVPILNAAGRMGKADMSCKLLISDDDKELNLIIDELLKFNDNRRNIQLENYNKFKKLLNQQCNLLTDKILIIYGEGIEHGVTGIVASQFVREFYRPVILLIVQDDEAMGAARSIERLNIIEMLSDCSDLLKKYGGHAQAAGLSLPIKNIDEFVRRMKNLVDEKITTEVMTPVLEIDSPLEFHQINMKLLDEIAKFEPFGFDNPLPTFCIYGAYVRNFSLVGNEGQHLKLSIESVDGHILSGIGWGMKDLANDLFRGKKIDCVFQLQKHQWQKKNYIDLIFLDIRTHI